MIELRDHREVAGIEQAAKARPFALGILGVKHWLASFVPSLQGSVTQSVRIADNDHRVAAFIKPNRPAVHNTQIVLDQRKERVVPVLDHQHVIVRLRASAKVA